MSKELDPQINPQLNNGFSLIKAVKSSLKNRLSFLVMSLLPFGSLSSSSYFFVDDIDTSKDSWVLEEDYVIEIPKEPSSENTSSQLTSSRKSVDVGTETQDEGPEGPAKKEAKPKKESSPKKDKNLDAPPTASAFPSIPPPSPPKKKSSENASQNESSSSSSSSNSIDIGTEAEDEGPEEPSVKKTKRKSKWWVKTPAPAAAVAPAPAKNKTQDSSWDYEDDASDYDDDFEDDYAEDEVMAESESQDEATQRQVQDKPAKVRVPWQDNMREKETVLLV